MQRFIAVHRAIVGGFSRNVLTGAAWGAALAGLCLLVGLARGLLVLLAGGSLAVLTAADVRLVEFYVGGFVAAGAFVGALRPLLRRKAAIYAALAGAGAMVMNTIAVADQGWSRMDRGDWLAMTACGALFGVAAAYGYLKDH